MAGDLGIIPITRLGFNPMPLSPLLFPRNEKRLDDVDVDVDVFVCDACGEMGEGECLLREETGLTLGGTGRYSRGVGWAAATRAACNAASIAATSLAVLAPLYAKDGFTGLFPAEEEPPPPLSRFCDGGGYGARRS